MPHLPKYFFLLSLALSFCGKTTSQLCLPGIVPCVPETECRCNIFEFPWVFCLFQFFDCADECTTGRDINELACRLGSNCAWNTGSGLGGCDCPDKCTGEDQREDSMRKQFMEACPQRDLWTFPRPCADSFGEDWECGFLYYQENSTTISQFTIFGSVIRTRPYNIPKTQLRLH